MKNMKKTVGIIGTITLVLLIAVVALFVVFLKMRDSKKVTIHKLTDIEWYSEDQKEFTISTAEELYDLATLSDFYDFKGQTIKLDADIVLNEGNAEDWEKVAPVNKWFPIEGFAGIFDGQGHTISGVYAKFTDLEIGLFNNTDPSCVIQDFRLVNSYFNSRGHIGAGALAGNAAGTFKKIYTDAIVVGFNKYKAGFIGRSTGDLTMEECWFDGSISNITDIEKSDWSYEKYQYSGGFIGDVQKGNITLEHCLNTGLNHTKAREGETARFGGFIGSIYGANKASVVINDCFFAGTLSSDGASSMVATIVGRQGVQDGISTPLTITNTYATKESLKIETLHNFKVDRLYQAEGAITEDNVKMLKEESLYGVQAYQRMNLDFDKYWVMREKDVPTLRYFAQEQKEFNVDGLERAADMVKDTSWLKEAEGTADDPYILKDAADLYGFAKLVNKGNVFAGKTIKLAADIKVNSGKAMDWSKKEPLAEWDSIQQFAGTFDGAGYTISGLYYKKDNTKTENIGLFGTTAETAVIKNFKLKNTYFAYTGDKDSVRMGSVLGCGNGRVEGIYSDAIVENTKFGTGGLVGSTVTESKLVINNCWFDGQIKINSNATAYAGGIIGMIAIGDLEIAHCLNSGSVHTDADKTQAPRVGGIIGSIDGGSTAKAVINDCLNVGKISTGGAISQVSAIVGRQNNPKNVNTPLTLTNCFATEESIPKELLEFGGKDRLYQATGEVTVNNVKMYPTNEITDVGAYQRTSLDFDKYWSIRKNNTPVLKKFANVGETISTAGLDIDRAMDLFKDTSWFDEAKGTAADPYILKDAEDLYGFAYLVNNGNDFAGKVVKLAANIIVSRGKASDWATKEGPLSSWTPLKKFAGTFDGAGHEISGLYYKKTDTQVEYIGFFGETTKDAVVKNLSLKNSYFGYVADKDATRMGSIVGVAKGKIENVYSNAIVESNTLGTGGLVGATESTLIIRNCWFDGSVTVKVAGLARSGGILGFANDGATVQISHCLNSGTVNNEKKGTQVGGILGFLRKSTATITDCLNTGVVNGNGIINQVTALVGRVDDGGILTIDKSYATNECLTNIDSFTASHISRNEHLYQNGGGTVISENVVMLDAERIQGVYALKNTKLDFTSYWAPITEKTPLLMSFVANKSDIADTSMLVVADKSWFNEALGNAEDPYVLETAADLFGFAELANAGYNFSGRYITLKNDIVVNDATVDEMLAEEPFNVWQPIEEFAGTFDGKGYTISGLYKNTAESGVQLGLFGTTTKDSVVKNVRLANTYFEYTGTQAGTYMGSIAGYGAGTFDTIYSDAVLKHNINGAGGIVGGTEETLTITNCWFNGSITITIGGTLQTGGILGFANNGATLEISHCLNSGSIFNEKKGTQIGGILGFLRKSTATITDCLNTGEVNGNGVINQVTALVGRIDAEGKLTLDKTYATYESLTNIGSFNATHLSGNQHLYQNAGGSVVCEGVAMLSETGVNGYSNITDTDAYVYTLLKFDSHWSAVEGKTPILTSFVTNEEIKDVTGLDRMIGISTKWVEKATGTESDPYVLKEAADLYGLATLVNNGNTFAGKHIVMANDITVNTSSRDTWATKPPLNSWTAIGSYNSRPFQGHFDGQGYTISGLYQMKTSGNSGQLGLFGYTKGNCVIENLKLKNSQFTYTGTEDGGRMGSFVAWADAGVYRNLYSDAHLTNSKWVIGGILGLTNGTVTISNCWFAGSVKSTGVGNDLKIGGLLGWAAASGVTVEHCLNSGTVHCDAEANRPGVGGLVGYINNGVSMEIKDCLNTGRLTTNGAFDRVAALVGTAGAVGGSTTLILHKTYATEESIGVEKLLSSTYYNTTVPLYQGVTKTVENVSRPLENTIKGINGYKNTLLDFDDYWTAVDGGTPILTTFVTDEKVISVEGIDRPTGRSTVWANKTGHGTESNPYIIEDAADFAYFVELMNVGSTPRYQNVHFALGDDIVWNASDRESWSTTAPLNSWKAMGNSNIKFAGHFDGRGYSISGLYQVTPKSTVASTAGYYGLFSHTTTGCVIENLSIKNSIFTYSGNDDFGRMGSFVAWADAGTFRNLYSDAQLTNSKWVIGGIVGLTNGNATISNCWFDGSVKSTGTGNDLKIGGVLGWAAASTLTVEHCLNSGSVHCDAEANHPAVGGLVGFVGNGIDIEITDCLNTGKLTTNGAYDRVATLVGSSGNYPSGSNNLVLRNSYATDESMGISALLASNQYNNSLYQGSRKNVENVARVSENRLYGNNATVNTNLMFDDPATNEPMDGFWEVVEGKTPKLRMFTDKGILDLDKLEQ